jgi:predicted O-linked N-acetylglucosamine transferase (SPINDLY family)
LLLFRHTLRGATVDEIKRNFTGILEDRVELRHDPGARGFLGVYDDVDILLDCLPWSGHVTTCEALWQGVPVLTLRGDRHAGRLSATVLTALGLTDWIADTPEGFRSEALCRANDVRGVAALRASMRDRMRRSPLCDGVTFTRRLETAFREMWQGWCAGQKPLE